MEASAAGLAGGGDAPAGGEATEQGEQTPQGPDFGQQLQDALGPMQAQLEDVRTWLEQNPPAQEQETEQQTDPATPPDLSYLDPSSPNYDAQTAANQFLQLLEQQHGQQMEPLMQEIGQLRDGLADMRSQAEAEQLAAEFPDLAKQEVSDKVFALAQQWAERAGLPPEAAKNMQVIRMVYMAGRAAEAANAEASGEQPAAANLEGAGGAAPAAPVGGLTAESIVGAPGRSVLPFG